MGKFASRVWNYIFSISRLITIWGIFSIYTWAANHPEAFQRLGSFGVAVFLIVFFVQTYQILNTKHSIEVRLFRHLADEVSHLNGQVRLLWKIIITQRKLSKLPETLDEPDEAWTKDRREVENEVDEMFEELRQVATSASKLDEELAKARKEMDGLYTESGKLESEVSKQQVAPVVVATIQWGYGDMLVKFTHSIIPF